MSTSTFRQLHHGPRPLLLPNAWDAGTARLSESLGAAAIATTSVGVAWSHGYPDGDALPLSALAATVAEIVRVVRVPVSVDIEGGYSDDPASVAQVVARVLDAGAVGINLEDGTGTPESLCAKIEAARRAAREAGIDLFVNVRTDVYLRGLAQGEAAVAEVTRRAARYRDAGGDGLFVPGLVGGDDIRAIATAIDPQPLNLMLVPGLPDPTTLHAQGVRRLSAGAAIAMAAMARTARLASEFLEGRWQEAFAESVDYATTNRLFDGQ